MRLLDALLAITLVLSGTFVVSPAEAADRPDPWTPHPGSGSPASHGPASIEEGPVELSQDDEDDWIATQRIVITNDLGGAAHTAIQLATQAGSIQVTHGGENDPREDLHGYALVATLRGQGDDEPGARAKLERWTVDHTDTLSQGELELSTRISLATDEAGLTSYLDPEPSFTGPRLELFVPPGPFHEMQMNTTGAGSIEIEGAFARLHASTDVGSITALLEPWTSGHLEVVSELGSVEVELIGTERNGYDAVAMRGAGDIEIELPDAESRQTDPPLASGYATGQQARTDDFDARASQTAIQVASRVGSVSVVATADGPAWRGQLDPLPAPAPDAGASARQPIPLPDQSPISPATTVALGLTAALLAALVVLRDKLRFGVLALYHRIRDRDVLSNPVRREILTLVGERPGIHFRALARELEAGHGQLDHHLTKLIDAGALDDHSTPSRTCYFLAGQVSPDVREPIALLQADGLRRVLEAAAGSPGAAVHELAETAGLATTTVSEHVRKLADRGLVWTERDGRTRRVRVTMLAERVLANLQG